LRIHDEGGALRNALLVEDAERTGQILADVGEHRERQPPQVLVILAPRKVHELAVDGPAQNLGVAIRELIVLARELRDFGRTHEGEVLRPEEHDQPFAGVRVVGDGREGLVELVRYGRLQCELGETVAYGQHENILLLLHGHESVTVMLAAGLRYIQWNVY